MDHQDTLHTLVGQIEQATRELDSYSYGPEHDQVRQYYTGLVVGGTPAPIARECARRAVLFALLYRALPTCVGGSHHLFFLEGSPPQHPRLEDSQSAHWLGAR